MTATLQRSKPMSALSGKVKPCEAPGCRIKFIPQRPFQCWCSPDCAVIISRQRVEKQDKAAAKAAKAARLAEKRRDKERLQQLRPISVIEEECRKIVQKIARIRDRDDPCISCDLPANWDGQWHGSHFRSHGACTALQFHLWNIHKACWICNKLYSGRIDVYTVKLIAKVGQERVDWLKAQNQVVRPSREYLARFKKVMGKRLRRMGKRYANQF